LTLSSSLIGFLDSGVSEGDRNLKERENKGEQVGGLF